MSKVTLPATFPNLLGLGASKSGTSSLYAYLRQHPEICLSVPKETHYFIYEEVYSLGPEGLVAHYFKGAEGHKIIGDISPAYFIANDLVINRIKACYGHKIPKFILIFRNPVERAWSHYLHKVRTGEESETFADAIALEEERLLREPFGWWGYTSEGRYAYHLRYWLEAFPRDKFLFLLTEDLAADPFRVLKTIYRFLDVDPNYVTADLVRHNTAGAIKSKHVLSLLNSRSALKSVAKQIIPLRYRQRLKTRIIDLNTNRHASLPVMPPDVRARLGEYYKSDIEELEIQTGLDLRHWKQGHVDI